MFALIAFPVVALYKGDFDHNANVYVATLNATVSEGSTEWTTIFIYKCSLMLTLTTSKI